MVQHGHIGTKWAGFPAEAHFTCSSQIIDGPFDPILSHKVQYSSLYEITPKDSSLHQGMVQLMLHFGFWVGLVASDDLRGESFISDLKGEMVKNGICVAFSEKISNSFMQSSATVIVIYGDTDSLMILRYLKPSTSTKVWIISPHWDVTVRTTFHYGYPFHGSLIFSHQVGHIPGFEMFLRRVKPSNYPENIFLKSFWHSAFECSEMTALKEPGDCFPNASLDMLPLRYFEVTMSASSYIVYNAVYAVAWALHAMFLVRSEVGSIGAGGNPVPHHLKLHAFLKNITLRKGMGDVVFTDETKKKAKYDILNYVNFFTNTEVMVKVGHFIPRAPSDQEITIHEEMIE
ncbi:LOW QUALITY PROTEIN: vomeronasal type-2 receptor 26-like [Trichechus inunguis]